ncbi:MAG TPA: ATP-binding protein [Pyrinomonadaceae bacterium]
MEFFGTFRGRLLLIFAFLIIATLGVQYYLNLLTQAENDRRREVQEQTLSAGIELGVSGITSTEYMQDLIAEPGQTFLDENARDRIRNIIIINNRWQITDSLDPDLVPTTAEDGTPQYKELSEVTDLPPLMEVERIGADLQFFPNRPGGVLANDTGDEAHAIRVQTSDGPYYVMVLLKNDKEELIRRAAQPLLATLGILLISTLITILLVWRFTRPIANLSNAAREVAAGNLFVRVPDNDSYDEMGQLARNFNEMTSELAKTRELEAQLQQAEKSAVIGRLGSAIAHEIRNPLNYINLTLDHLRSKFAPEDGDQRASFVKLTSQLKDEVARINQQITDFLNYSRPANADLRPIEVRDVIERSLRLVEAQAAENNIKIAVVEHEDVPQVMGDPEFLRSVFNNLFINGVQAIGGEGGNLNVKITPENGFVQVEVADTGIGISEENLEKVFEPYFSTKETGTGLGLAIVQKIIDVHHGSIEVDSTEGEGTRFTVRLPRAHTT